MAALPSHMVERVRVLHEWREIRHRDRLMRRRGHSCPALPEWLVTGTWITASPNRVRDLPKEARSFVNEFAPVPSDGVDATRDRERMVAHDRDAHVPPRREESAAPPHGDKLR